MTEDKKFYIKDLTFDEVVERYEKYVQRLAVRAPLHVSGELDAERMTNITLRDIFAQELRIRTRPRGIKND